MEDSTDLADLARKYIFTTHSHVFLTGKAGTGKTTFLKSIIRDAEKRVVVVAPTGIAALNAGGVTIHSLFQLPMGTFIPTRQMPVEFMTFPSYDEDALMKRHFVNAAKRAVIRGIELLVIDEVSMLRADILDAIDFRLRTIRGNHLPFGGVQLLLIGDLYQLPPVVRDDERSLLMPYYRSAWFYESIALKKVSYIFIEFEKVYRQQDAEFVQVLNHFRENKVRPEDLDLLNTRVRKELNDDEKMGLIHITTHNAKAEQINRDSLQSLAGVEKKYLAAIQGEFPKSSYPTEEELTVKIGAQVMFIRNDSSGAGRYYNGKIGTVEFCGKDEIGIRGTEDKVLHRIEPFTWENKKYEVDPETHQQRETVTGSFTQFPIRLAWAITVHKSQGLTFNRAMIDVSSAFAAGQTYVALSRLRSLDGLMLNSRIESRSIFSDEEIRQFSSGKNMPDILQNQLKDRQLEFLLMSVDAVLNFKEIERKMDEVVLLRNNFKGLYDTAPFKIVDEFRNLQVYRSQLHHLMQSRSWDNYIQRIEKGCSYYLEMVWHDMATTMEFQFIYVNMWEMNAPEILEELDELFVAKLKQLTRLPLLAKNILLGESDSQPFSTSGLRQKRDMIFKNLKEKYPLAEQQEVVKPLSKRKKSVFPKTEGKKEKNKKLPSHLLSAEEFNKGISPENIARARGISVSTIFEHLTKAALEEKVEFGQLISPEEIGLIGSAKNNAKSSSLKEIFEHLEQKIPYWKIRLAMEIQKRETTA